MDKLQQKRTFPQIREGQKLFSYLGDLIDWQENLYAKTTDRVNYLLDRFDSDDAVHIGNNWRLKEVGSNLEVQKLESGSWNTKATFTA